jgi:uncharacterized protein
MNLWHGLVVFASAFLAGMINSVAGGGTLLAFPALLWMGIDPLRANVTCTVALWPGSLGGLYGFRREMAGSRRWIALLIWPSIIGALSGAFLLLITPPRTFAVLVPYLILFATILFAVGEPLTKRLSGFENNHWRIGAVIFQFFVAVYGGYFGAGIGILMLAALGLLGMSDIYQMQGLKNLLAMCINGVAAIYFMLMGPVVWRDALVMAGGAILGGYGAAGLARRLGRTFLRRVVIVIGLALAASLLLQK